MNDFLILLFLYHYKGISKIVIPGRCRKQREEALDLIDQYSCYMDVYLSTGIPILEA